MAFTKPAGCAIQLMGAPLVLLGVVGLFTSRWLLAILLIPGICFLIAGRKTK